MRESFELDEFIEADKKWREHEARWREKLRAAKQPSPTEQQIESYRQCWLEGFLARGDS